MQVYQGADLHGQLFFVEKERRASSARIEVSRWKSDVEVARRS